MEQLTDAARSVDPDISPRTIKAWQQEGLLPEPTRAPVPGQKRGRAPYRFPSETAAIVHSLARWRRYVAGADQAKVWLYLEGYNHVALPIHPLFYDGWIVQALIRGQEKLPALCHIGILYPTSDVPPEANVKLQGGEEICDDIDRYIISPLDEKRASSNTLKAIALLGIGFYLGWQFPDETGEFIRIEDCYGFSNNYQVLINAALTELLDIPTSVAMPFSDTEILQILESINLTQIAANYIRRPNLVLRWYGRRQALLPRLPAVNWPVVRRLWQRVCQITDPPLQENLTRIQTIPELLTALRRLAYRRDNNAIITVIVLGLVSSIEPFTGLVEHLASGAIQEASAAI